MPVVRTLSRFTESFVFYPIEFVPDIRTFHAGYKNMSVIRTLYAVPDDVLVSGIHCIRISKVCSVGFNFNEILQFLVFHEVLIPELV